LAERLLILLDMSKAWSSRWMGSSGPRSYHKRTSYSSL